MTVAGSKFKGEACLVMTSVSVNGIESASACVILMAAFPNPKAKVRLFFGIGCSFKYFLTAVYGSTALNAAARMRRTRGSCKDAVENCSGVNMLQVYLNVDE